MNHEFLFSSQAIGAAPFSAASGLGELMIDCESQDDRAAVAEYISDLTAELALMAAWAEHADLARMLEMARLESEQLCGRAPGQAEPAVGDTTAAPEAVIDPSSTNVVLLSPLRTSRR
jgi:hypothetical protein